MRGGDLPKPLSLSQVNICRKVAFASTCLCTFNYFNYIYCQRVVTYISLLFVCIPSSSFKIQKPPNEIERKKKIQNFFFCINSNDEQKQQGINDSVPFSHKRKNFLFFFVEFVHHEEGMKKRNNKNHKTIKVV